MSSSIRTCAPKRTLSTVSQYRTRAAAYDISAGTRRWRSFSLSTAVTYQPRTAFNANPISPSQVFSTNPMRSQC
eukprot:3086225-Rhodomonas_salina.1